MFYKSILKPILFSFPPEKAHQLTISLFKMSLAIPILSNIVKKTFELNRPNLERKFLGLSFKNPVGLAAGFDKDGKYYHEMAVLGFGFVELGTVTPKPQQGNPQPRLFRLPQDDALINRMGFNNLGVDQLVEQLKRGRPKDLVIGGNIGKNKVTPNESAIEDYAYCFNQLFEWVDYFVVNVSSPNTPNLRALQEKEPLKALLNHLQELNQQKPTTKPILLKIAPDLTNEQLDDIIEIVQETKIDGVIATNTTISRSGLNTSNKDIESIGNGGLSGAPVTDRATEVIRYLNQQTNGNLFIIGVGGINSLAAAQEKLDAGASLIQIYSGLVYEGPGLIKTIKQGL